MADYFFTYFIGIFVIMFLVGVFYDIVSDLDQNFIIISILLWPLTLSVTLIIGIFSLPFYLGYWLKDHI